MGGAARLRRALRDCGGSQGGHQRPLAGTEMTRAAVDIGANSYLPVADAGQAVPVVGIVLGPA